MKPLDSAGTELKAEDAVTHGGARRIVKSVSGDSATLAANADSAEATVKAKDCTKV